MKISIVNVNPRLNEVRPGNVYPCAGGWGRKAGMMMVLLAVTEPGERHDGGDCLMLVVDKEGNPRDVTKYGRHILEDRVPIAFVEEIDSVVLQMRSI